MSWLLIALAGFGLGAFVGVIGTVLALTWLSESE